MLAEFIQSIVKLADDRQTFKTLDLPGGRKRMVYTPAGEMDEVTIPPEDVDHRAMDLSSFGALLADSDNLGVFFDGATATGFYDIDDRRDRVLLSLRRSKSFVAFASANEIPMKQADIVAALRDDLFGCVDSGLLPMFRSLDFSRRNDGSRTIDHGRESLGASVEQSVRSKRGEIPEHIEIDLPFWGDEPFTEFRRKFTCSVVIDAASERISLKPRGDEFSIAVADSNKFAAQVIRAHFLSLFPDRGDVLVVCGSP